MSNVVIGCISVVCVERTLFVGIQCAKGRGIIMPGGKWEVGETFKQTAHRELREEAGIGCREQELFFQGFAEDGSFTYAFVGRGADDVWATLGTDIGSGVIGLYPSDEFIKSKFGGYYELMFDKFYRKVAV